MCVAAAGSLATGVASASSAFEIAGSQTSLNGLNSRAMARGAEVTFYNPALLPAVGDRTEVGAYILITNGRIELDPRPAGIDVTPAIYDANRRNVDDFDLQPFPTDELPTPRDEDRLIQQTRPYMTIGVTAPILGEKLVFGFYSLLPIQNIQQTRASFPDEREQYFENNLDFELLGDRAEISSFAVALGSRPLDWLSLGAGVDISLTTEAKAAVYVPDAADQRRIFLNPDIDVNASIVPYFGLETRPIPALGLTATAHLPVGSDTDGRNDVRFFNFTYEDGEDSVVQLYKTTQGSTPLRVGLGSAYQGIGPDGDVDWEVGGHVTLERWSDYRDRHAERPLDRWSNTYNVAAGTMVVFAPGAMSVDLAYRPSPVPAQKGRTNYVDNDKLLASAGFETPVSVLGVGFSFGVFAHAQYLMPRSVDKDLNAPNPVIDEFPDGARSVIDDSPIPDSEGLQTNNPGYPGFSSRGYIMGIGAAIRFPAIRRER